MKTVAFHRFAITTFTGSLPSHAEPVEIDFIWPNPIAEIDKSSSQIPTTLVESSTANSILTQNSNICASRRVFFATMASSVLAKFLAAEDAVRKYRGRGQFVFQSPSIPVANRIQQNPHSTLRLRAGRRKIKRALLNGPAPKRKPNKRSGFDKSKPSLRLPCHNTLTH